MIWHLIKDENFRDNPPNPEFRLGDAEYKRLLPLYSSNHPEVHEVIRGLRAVIDEFSERVLIGEVYLPVEKLAAYYGRDLSGAHLPFNFGLIETPFTPRAIAVLIERYEKALPQGAWPNWVMGNHDVPRLATRVGPQNAALAAMLLVTTLRGTPTLYYGDEIGMPQVAIVPSQARDPRANMCLAATAPARRCNGTRPRSPDFRAPDRGCRSPTALPASMWRVSVPIPLFAL